MAIHEINGQYLVGLYMISQLGQKYGQFTFSSSGHALSIQEGKLDWQRVPVLGTAVKANIGTEDGDYWPNILNQIVEAGEGQAATMKCASKKASKMSSTT